MRNVANAQINSGSRSILAKLLAQEDISVRHSAAVRTAHFELGTRVLMLPIWQDILPELYDMLVIHEVGHALETPKDAWMAAIDDISKRCSKTPERACAGVKDFLNVVEDPRIDKLQMRRYPGSRRDYAIGYQELHDRDFFSLAEIERKTGRGLNSMDFIDRANIYCKGGKRLGIKFSKVEKAFIDRIGATETFAEVVALTEEIYVWSRKNKKEKKPQPSPDMDILKDLFDQMEKIPQDAIPQDDDAEVEDAIPQDEEEGDPDAEADDEDKAEDEREDNAFENATPRTKDEDEDEDEENEESDEDPESLTEQAAEDNAGKLLGTGTVDYSYAQTPAIKLENILDDYKKVLAEQTVCYNDRLKPADASRGDYYTDDYYVRQHARADADLIRFRQAENPTISYMVKEFEMRKAAAIYSRSAQSKTGVLDTNKLHSYRYNDDVFKKLTVIPEGKNHGFVMFVDWSASMTGNLNDTVKQLLSLVWFCKRVSIPFEVYTFRSEMRNKEDEPQPEQFSTNHGDLSPGVFRLRNNLSSRMNTQDFNLAVRYIWLQSYREFKCDPMNSTPLYQSMMVAAKIVNDFRKKNGVEVVNTIFLTDGDGDGIGKPQGDSDFNSFYGSKKELLITDSTTKKVYKVDGLGRTDVQKIFLQMLKDQTGSNVLGFFLTNNNYRHIAQRYKSWENATTEGAFYRNNGFFAAKDVGYDDFYVINPGILSGRQNEEMMVDSTQTKAAAKKEFLRSLTQKNNNRILLKMFMKKVCNAA